MPISNSHHPVLGHLPPTILASGIADAFFSLHLMLGWSGVFTIGGLSVLAFVTKNRDLDAFLFALCLPFAMLLVPWTAPFRNFDESDFGGDLCLLAYASYVVVVVAVGRFISTAIKCNTEYITLPPLHETVNTQDS